MRRWLILWLLRLFPQFRALELKNQKLRDLVTHIDTPDWARDVEWEKKRQRLDPTYVPSWEADAAYRIDEERRRAIQRGEAPGPGALSEEEMAEMRRQGFTVYP